MNISQLNPYLRYIQKRKSPVLCQQAVKAYDHRLIFIISGRMQVFINNQANQLFENELIIIPPATEYLLFSDTSTEYYIINFDFVYEKPEAPTMPPDIIDEFCEEKVISSQTCSDFPLVLKCEAATTKTLDRIDAAQKSKSPLYNEYISLYLKEIIIRSMIFTKNNEIPELVKNALEYINNHYTEDFTNKELSRMLSYHPNYINRILKEYTGKSIKNTVIELRLQYAENLLCTTKYDIGKISEICGFASYSYFIKSFKNYWGMSPLQYKKQSMSIM